MAVKSIIIALASVILLPSSTTFAQKPAQPANSHTIVNRMAKELKLNDSQRSQVEAILNEEKIKVEAVFNEEKMKLQVIQEETHTRLQAVLTPEQMQQLDRKMRQRSSAGRK